MLFPSKGFRRRKREVESNFVLRTPLVYIIFNDNIHDFYLQYVIFLKDIYCLILVIFCPSGRNLVLSACRINKRRFLHSFVSKSSDDYPKLFNYVPVAFLD